MDLPEVAEAKRRLVEVIRLLLAAGHAGWAGGLRASLGAMEGRRGTQEALQAVGIACHPKALGDLHFPGLPEGAWAARLAELHDACAAAFEALERLPPERREGDTGGEEG